MEILKKLILMALCWVLHLLPDKDECNGAQYPCGSNSECENTAGGFKCKCRKGFNKLNNETVCSKVISAQRSLLSVFIVLGTHKYMYIFTQMHYWNSCMYIYIYIYRPLQVPLLQK